jgi:hypothetical protein
VNELLSMLVPLETLSGWPQAPNPSILASLAIFVGFPVLVFIIVVAIAKIGTAAHTGRGDTIQASDPFWVGDHESGELETASANPGTEAYGRDADQAFAREAEQASVGDGDVKGDDTGEHVGGAGARW